MGFKSVRPAHAALVIATALVTQPALAGPPAANEPPAPPASLEEQFRDPPAAARPRVWWHWMNGNVTKEGIDKDLAWMARIGIGGVQNFDASLQTPQIVAERLPFMTEGWKEAFCHAVRTADAKGLEFAIAASPGWSETGGPWVKPEDAMKKLVWSETVVSGGRRVDNPLPAPPRTTVAFQSAEFFDPLGSGERRGSSHYADTLVLAYPIDGDPLPTPKTLSSDGRPFDAAALADTDLESTLRVAKGTSEAPGALILDYGKQVTVRAATLFVPRARMPFREPDLLPRLEAETASGWSEIGRLPLADVATTIAFPPVSARRFRLVLGPNDGLRPPELGEGAPGAEAFDIFARPPSEAVDIGELRLFAEPKIDRYESKAGFAVAPDYLALTAGTAAKAPATASTSVLDLTSRLRSDGTLDWIAPGGRNWRVLRMGYSLTGKTNHPATPEATGLEVDKYDAAAVRRYLETYLGLYRDAVGAQWMGKKGIRALVTDSIEVGASNWTADILSEFQRRRGYDPKPFLPALTGAVIDSVERSDAFLHDYRQTLADLLAEAHYGTIAKVAHEHGLRVYGEALENGRPVLGDDLAMRAHADVPMAAMWAFNRGGAPRPTLLGDIKGAASVAHIYGQNVVAAESLTSAQSPWAFAPADLKRVIDLEFVSGVNLPVIHTSVHQPVDDKQPGLSLMVFGQYFNRHETWAEMAKPWVDYIARTSFMLQQGRDHSDVAWFYGEDQPITALFEHGVPAGIPRRYGYDFVNAEILASRLAVENGELVAKGSGARYRALYLGGSSRVMTLSTLRRLAELAQAGATIIGLAPERNPSLADDPTAFRDLVGRLWGGKPLGRGRVIASDDLEGVLARLGLGPDFSVNGGTPAAYQFLHRKLEDGDLYFVRSTAAKAETIEARFRVSGRQPEIWRAVDGKAVPASYRIDGGETLVPLDVEPEDALFVLFRKPAEATERKIPAAVWEPVATLDGRWTVKFQPGRGARAEVAMSSLSPLEQSADPRIRFFSGTATYASHFTLPKSKRTGLPLWIDLGRVGDVAELRVNGKAIGTAWLAPYRLDISRHVKIGRNAIEIKVANLWVNRLIGDKQPESERVTFTTAPTYRADAPLRPSGLIGPVRLLTKQAAQ